MNYLANVISEGIEDQCEVELWADAVDVIGVLNLVKLADYLVEHGVDFV